MSKLNQEELLEWLEQAHKYFTFEPPGKDNQAYQQIRETIQKPGVTEEWIEEKARESINKSFKDYETEIQAILFIDPINKSSYRKINKATDALVDHIWDSIRSLVEEIK